MKLDTTKSPIDSAVVTGLTADVTQSGKVSFTPTKLDTADYVFRVVVTDDWALKDTVDINIICYNPYCLRQSKSTYNLDIYYVIVYLSRNT